MEWAAQGNGEVIPASVQETTGCYGLVDSVVFGQSLDSMTLDISSSLNDSMSFLKLTTDVWCEWHFSAPSWYNCFHWIPWISVGIDTGSGFVSVN